MKPQTFTWKKLTADELTRVYLDEMRRDFPPSELKPLSMILNSEAVGMAHTWGCLLYTSSAASPSAMPSTRPSISASACAASP